MKRQTRIEEGPRQKGGMMGMPVNNPPKELKPKEPPPKSMPEHNTYEIALLQDIRTLLAFKLQHEIFKCKKINMFEGTGKNIKENAKWALEYIKQNRIL